MGATLRLQCRDFQFYCFQFDNDVQALECFETIKRRTVVPSIENLYAFHYNPGRIESCPRQESWSIYSASREYERMGAISATSTDYPWRLSKINSDYKFCETYPSEIVVPATISDSVLKYAAKFRSKNRLPALSYFHRMNKCTITRSSQPLVGLKQNRSIQDERLVQAIFESNVVRDSEGRKAYGAASDNLIVDARPTANALAQTALGAGSEVIDNYASATKCYLGIENIHAVRDSLIKVLEIVGDADISPLSPNKIALMRTGWLKHMCTVLNGGILVSRHIHLFHSHVLLHCSDGWDRTAQVSSIAQILLDPYFRTLDGFMVLIEKEYVAFGHRFLERCGHLSNEKSFVISRSDRNQAQAALDSLLNTGNPTSDSPSTSSSTSGLFSIWQSMSRGDRDAAAPSSAGVEGQDPARMYGPSNLKFTSPIFQQFLDAVYQLIGIYPDRFEYNERFLRRLVYHTYSCQYGTFLLNCERDRVLERLSERTRSVWDYFRARRKDFTSEHYDPKLDEVNGPVLLVPMFTYPGNTSRPGGSIRMRERDYVSNIKFDTAVEGRKEGLNVPLYNNDNPPIARWWAGAFGRSDEEMNGYKRRERPDLPLDVELSGMKVDDRENDETYE
ncbi:hypothetical protein CANCADRAFT_32262 [Tortispora caseinolytica NRRL Y-17796]|uniref:Myotubularin phosphatase domain-containing protein n=1 Tax=Tortispora caseinolytica NRRL Y-17796 TaxID=767744 RepID=A0A1E4TAL4_9ASCO|nr:hypothetical protein CANCADRAFT_32262 [Tortispora caseinolytica NRRL Y-17796]